jgi:4-aminobutyrate aminotransferase-like enzyme
MREDGVLAAIEGEYGNILKIRSPLVFRKANADQLVAALDSALAGI